MHKLVRELLDIDGIKLSEFEELMGESFSTALEKSKILRLKQGIQFITSGENVDYVYILLSGEVRALQEYTSGNIFSFRKFRAEEIFGEMEILADIDEYRASIVTNTDCVFLVLPKQSYVDFLKQDADFLYKRTRIIIKRELEEHAHLRTFLMIKAIDRIKIYLLSNYDHLCPNQDICLLKITRKQMMDETGYSIRTIGRSLKKLQEEELLTLDGRKIIITRNQYRNMRKSVEGIINS